MSLAILHPSHLILTQLPTRPSRPFTFTMSSEYRTRNRFTILFCTFLALNTAGLQFAIAYFAATLRDRAGCDYTTNGILYYKFQDHVFQGMLAAGILVTAYTIFGFMIAVYRCWLENRMILVLHEIFRLAMVPLMIGTGVYLVSNVHGFHTSFERFGGNDKKPYYGIMYYGGVAHIACGVVIAITAFAIRVK